VGQHGGPPRHPAIRWRPARPARPQRGIHHNFIVQQWGETVCRDDRYAYCAHRRNGTGAIDDLSRRRGGSRCGIWAEASWFRLFLGGMRSNRVATRQLTLFDLPALGHNPHHFDFGTGQIAQEGEWLQLSGPESVLALHFDKSNVVIVVQSDDVGATWGEVQPREVVARKRQVADVPRTALSTPRRRRRQILRCDPPRQWTRWFDRSRQTLASADTAGRSPTNLAFGGSQRPTDCPCGEPAWHVTGQPRSLAVRAVQEVLSPYLINKEVCRHTSENWTAHQARPI